MEVHPILTDGYTGGAEGEGRFASSGGAISKEPGGARSPPSVGTACLMIQAVLLK